VETVAGSDWLFLGLADGTIDVFDLRVGKLAPYRIPDLMTEWRQFQAEERRKQGIEGPPKLRHPNVELVSTIQFHSTALNQLLIAYETAVILWDVREKVAVRVFEFAKNNGEKMRVTAMSWRPTGESQFVVGYDDGLLCLWDADKEDQPIAWRYIFQENHKSQDRIVLNEPIYKLAWCSAADFSETYLVVAGGTHPTDNHGINVLTFNKDSTFRDPARQSILPLSAEIADFLILPWSSPFFLGTNDPLGILVLTTKGDTLAFHLQQGYAEYVLPSAFSFASPRLRQFHQYANLDGQMYEALITPPPNTIRQPYLPLTGGIAGARHVYRLETTDIMITAHENGVIQIWDSSFVALRPLPHLTLHTFECMAQPQRSDITAFDFSEKTAALAVAYESGLVLYFVFGSQDEAKEEQSVSAHDTSRDIKATRQNIKELDNLIQDLGNDDAVQPEIPQDHGSLDTNVDSNNPFVNDANLPQQSTSSPPLSDAPIDEQAQKQERTTSPKETSGNTVEQQLVEDVGNHTINSDTSRFEVSHRPSSHPGKYELDFTLHTGLKNIVAMAQATGELLAVADKNGHICIVDAIKHKMVFDKTVITTEEDVENSEQNEVPSTPVESYVTILKFTHSYPPSTDKVPALQLLVGTSDGSGYQVILSKATAWSVLEWGRVCGPFGSALIDLYVIDLDGQEQSPYYYMNTDLSPVPSEAGSESVMAQSPPEEQPEPEAAAAAAAAESGSGFLKRSLTRKQSKSSKSSTSSPQRSKSVRETSSRSKPSRSRVQKDPHFWILVTQAGVRVHLNISQLKLFSFSVAELPENPPDAHIICANLVRREGAIVLSCVLTNGTIALFSLPHLELVGTCVAPFDNIQCAQVVQDGRLMISTDSLEVVQIAFLLQTNMRFEESIKLHDPNRQLPVRPSTHGIGGVNKSWFASVTAGLQRDHLSLQELDLLVGGRDRPLPKAPIPSNVKQKGPSSSSSGPGNVFQELGNKVNERGERLNELDQKFKEVNQASSDFLKAIKDYNERQAQKKWWEF